MNRNRKMFRMLTATNLEPNYNNAWDRRSSFYLGEDMYGTSIDHQFVFDKKNKNSERNIKKKYAVYSRHFNARTNCFWLLAVAFYVFSNLMCQVHCVTTSTASTPVNTASRRNIWMVTSYLLPNQTVDQYDQSTKTTTVVKPSDMQPVPKHRDQSTQYEPDKIRHKNSPHKLHQRHQQRGQKEIKTMWTSQAHTTQRTQTTQTTQKTELQTTQTTQKTKNIQNIQKFENLQTTPETEKLQTTHKIQKPQTTDKIKISQTPRVAEATSQTTLAKRKAQTTQKAQITQKLKTTEKQQAWKPQTTRHKTQKPHIVHGKKELPQPTNAQAVNVIPSSETTESVENSKGNVTTPPKTIGKQQMLSTYVSNTNDDQCPKKSMAYYNVTFVPLWSSRRFPKMYPMYRPHAQWSKTIGRTHDHKYSMWEIGSFASAKVKSLAERGVSTDFDVEVQGHKGVLDVFDLPAIGKGFGQSKGSMFVNSMHPLVSFMVKIIPSPDWFVGVSSLNLCSKKKWKKKVIMKLFPVDAGTDIGLTFTSPNWPAYPPEKINRITSSFPNHEASSFHYKSLKKLPRIGYATFYKVEEYKSIYKRTKPYKSRLPTLLDRLPPLVNRPSVANRSYKPSTNVQTGEHPAKSYIETVSSPTDDDDEEDFGNITNLLAVAENEPAIPLDCEVSIWGEWGLCSKTCGFGRRDRFRFVVQERKNNGYLCPQLKEEELCGSMRNCQWKYFKPFLSIAQKRVARTPGTAGNKKPLEQKEH